MANSQGRNRKPSAIRELEGNRSKRAIPGDFQIAGVPRCPDHLQGKAREHFEFVAGELVGAGVVKWLDTDALSQMAVLWQMFWLASEDGDIDAVCKLSTRWMAYASKFGLTPADRAKIMATPAEKPDEQEERFFKVMG